MTQSNLIGGKGPPGFDTDDPVSILVVDDQPANLVSVEAILGCPQYEIVTATSGSEALKYALMRDFAVILLDVMMPGMDGFEVARLVRQRQQSEATPIIFLTAIATDLRYLMQGYATGAVDYLQKPLVAEIVRAKVAVFADLCRKNRRIRQTEAALREMQRREQEKQLAEVRRASDHRYRELAEFMPQIVWTADTAGQMTYLNNRWQAYTGFSPDYSTGLKWQSAFHPDDIGKLRSGFRQASAESHSLETELRLKDGETGLYRWHLARAVPERDGSSKITGWLGTLTDIHAQKTAEAAQRLLVEVGNLFTSDTSYVTALTALGERVVASYADGCLIDVDLPGHPFLRVASLTRNDDKSCLEVSTRADAALVLGSSLQKGEPVFGPTDSAWFSAINDEARRSALAALSITGVASSPIKIRGKIGGAITLLRRDGHRMEPGDLDLASEMARHVAIAIENVLVREEAVDNNRRKDEFLAVLSHELRTPLNAIIGWTDLLQIEGLTPSGNKALEIVDRNAKSLMQLVEDLLDVSRIITGKFELERENLDIVDLVEQCLTTVRPLADSKNLVIDLNLPGRPLYINGDPNRLHQVFCNLLNNAIKFTHDGGHIQVSVTADAGNQIKVAVRDDGIGIDPAMAQQIFDRFRQVDSSITRKHSGLGLGLAIVRHLIDAHDGKVQVYSEGKGHGAEFTVELTGTEHRPTPRSAPEEAPSPSLTTLRGTEILLVDDDPLSRTLAATFLRRSGASVAIAGSVREAMARLDHEQPDLILTDIGMPEEDGFTLLRRLREREAGGKKRVPRGAISAYASSEDAKRALTAGFDIYLTKPIRGDLLVNAVSGLLESLETPNVLHS